MVWKPTFDCYCYCALKSFVFGICILKSN